ncbi:MAG: Gfo/Idh/MocA family oxidoreductase [Kineosporiaceae bacterium]
MTDVLRWGVLGTGGIAGAFVDEVSAMDRARVVAIGSRTTEGAARFAGEHGVPIAHGSLADLVGDDDVDAVYVATPHPAHAPSALAAIAAGKHVLVEKPFAMNADEARTVADAARAAGVFCMEAMWTRFLPHAVRIRALLADGAIGQVRTVAADHGQRFAPDPRHRLYAPELGGGAMLDLGIYPLSWAFMVLGAPSSLVATSEPAMTGVDAQTSAVLRYPDGAQAVITTTLEAFTARRAWISGTEGTIDVDPVFYAPTSFTLRRDDGSSERFTSPNLSGPGKGLRFEAAEVARCVRERLTESPVLPLTETVAIMEAMDEIHRQIGRPGHGSQGAGS